MNKVWSTSTKLYQGPNLIRDQINAADIIALKDLTKNCQLAIDVGTFAGASAEAIIEAMPAAGRLICVDTFRGTPGFYTGQVGTTALQKTLERLSKFKDRVTIVIGRSGDIGKLLKPAIADLVFLDAAHDYRSVIEDIRAWVPVLKESGVICGHDFDKRVIPENIERFSDTDIGPDNIHYGVIRAVLESFNEITLATDESCTLWATSPDQLKPAGRRT